MLLKVICALIVLIGLLPAWAFKVGVGMHDMTGPCTEINFMGYALPSQRGTGIHLRLRARAFAFLDETTNKRAVFVSVDGGMASDLVKMRVLDKLTAEFGEGVYTHENVAISGTHTHSGPGGFQQYVLYQVTSLGFVHETFNAWVDGISQAIIKANNRMQPAKTLVNSGMLYDSNINRSPTSYELNPEGERSQYPEGNTDKTMLLLSFLTDTKIPTNIGVLNWFAVHGTSLNNTNTLTSGDNKGYASYALEKDINGADVSTGAGQFVAAFASTNLGDVSPNTMGAKCIDTGLPCDGTSSTCNGKCQNCIAFGPGTNGDMYESCKIIGDKQYQFAKQLMASAKEEVTGPLDYRHSFVRMPGLNVTVSNRQVTLCSPSMGYSFAAGTTDGPGMFNFAQGTTTGNKFWDTVSGFLSKPTDEEIKCQAPKPILINTGDVDVPHEWDPETVPLQLLRLGNVFVIVAPSEFTTMAGRRLRAAVKQILIDGKIAGEQNVYVTIAGLANSYASYVTTFEEYQAQRYEAASTIYGPYTLDGYIQEFSRLARDMVSGLPSATGAAPEDLMDKVIQLIPEPKFDRLAKGVRFGDVVEGLDVKPAYKAGEVAEATFHAANPRNNQRLQGTFVEVDLKLSSDPDAKKTTWKTVANDGDWETKFQWRAGKEDPLDLGVSKQSIATISWAIPADAKEGTYRLCYQGDHKVAKMAKIVPFRGCSAEFTVSATGAAEKEHKHHSKHHDKEHDRKERE